MIETHPSRKGKASTSVTKPQLQTKICAKKRRVATTHSQKYRGSVHESRVNTSSQTLSTAKYPDEIGEDADYNDPYKSVAAFSSTHQEGSSK